MKATNRASILDEHKPYLHQRWREGCHDIPQLHRELRARGFTGSIQCVRRYFRPFKKPHNPKPKNPSAPAPELRPAPKPRRVVRWITTNPGHLAEADAAELKEIRAACPHLDATARHVRGFVDMMCDLRGDDLPAWIDRVLADDLPALHSLVNGIKHDLDAVTAGLSTPWSSGQVEGHVTRAKLLKRMGYGRANLDLLRRRILLAREVARPFRCTAIVRRVTRDEEILDSIRRDSGLADLLRHVCEFDLSRGDHGEPVRLSSGLALEGVAGDFTGGTFFLCGDGSKGRPVLYASSEGQAGLIGQSLTEALEIIVGLPSWWDCLKFSGTGDLTVMQTTADHLCHDELRDQPEIGADRVHLAAALGLELGSVPALLARLHTAVSATTPDFVLTVETGEEYESLFGPWLPSRNPSWQ